MSNNTPQFRGQGHENVPPAAGSGAVPPTGAPVFDPNATAAFGQGFPQHAPQGYPQQAPAGYPAQAPAQQAQQGYPQQAPAQQAPQGFPQQQAPQGFPQQQAPQGFPQQQAPQGFPQQQAPQGYAPGQNWAPPAAPSTPKVNPFIGIPISDYLRDGGAALLLLLSLALPWTLASDATGRVEVILITLLSLFSIAITYLARSGVFSPSTKVETIWLIRALANAPYLALVVIYIILDAVNDDLYIGGIGFAAIFGLAGAILAAMPRESEMAGVTKGHPISEAWWRIAIIVGAAFVALRFIGLIVGIVRGSFDGIEPVGMVSTIFGFLFTLAFIAAAYLGVVLRNEIWRLASITVGLGVLGYVFIELFNADENPYHGVELLGSGGYVLIAVAVAGVLSYAPPVRLAMQPSDPTRSWFGATSLLFLWAAATAVYLLIGDILSLSSGYLYDEYVGVTIGTIVLSVLAGLVAIVARTLLRSNPNGSRTIVLCLVGGLLVLGIIHVSIIASIEIAPSFFTLLLSFGFPLILGYLLTVPKPVRDFYAQVARSTAAAQPAQYAQPGYAQQTGVVQPGYAQQTGVVQPGYAPQPGGQPAAQAGAPWPHQTGVYPADGFPGAQNPADYQAPAAYPSAANPEPGFVPVAPTQAQPTGVVPSFTAGAPVASAPIASAPVASAPVTSAPVASAPVASPFQQAPTASAPVAPAPLASGFTAEQASNPATDAATLFAIAQKEPALRVQLAANPSTYPQLLDWLGGLGDEAVNAALRARGR